MHIACAAPFTIIKGRYLDFFFIIFYHKWYIHRNIVKIQAQEKINYRKKSYNLFFRPYALELLRRYANLVYLAYHLHFVSINVRKMVKKLKNHSRCIEHRLCKNTHKRCIVHRPWYLTALQQLHFNGSFLPTI